MKSVREQGGGEGQSANLVSWFTSYNAQSHSTVHHIIIEHVMVECDGYTGELVPTALCIMVTVR